MTHVIGRILSGGAGESGAPGCAVVRGEVSHDDPRIVGDIPWTLAQASEVSRASGGESSRIGRRYAPTVAPLSVELLYFEGCPNSKGARELVERIAAQLGVEADLLLVEVTSLEEAERLRFLGSPSIRVNGHDVEPGADDLDTFVLSCRVYRTDAGLRGTPSEEWIRAALHPS